MEEEEEGGWLMENSMVGNSQKRPFVVNSGRRRQTGDGAQYTGKSMALPVLPLVGQGGTLQV
jgi:hypothetical protein